MSAMVAASLPQALMTTYPSRLRSGNTNMLTPTPHYIALHSRRRARVFNPDDEFDTEDDFQPQELIVDIQQKPANRTRHIYRNDEQLSHAALARDVLIPIRLDLDLDTHRLKDSFTWNMNEELITPDQFAVIMCTDLDIPSAVFAPHISNSIRTQIEEYAPVAEIELPEGHELRVIVNLSLHMNKHLYQDKFEWDLTSSLTPEAFAGTICRDLGLAGEFVPAIAHAIHESVLRLKKEACEGGLPQEIENDAAYGAEAGWRVDQENLGEEWGPSVGLLSREEMDKRDGDRERQIRRLRRETARFGTGASLLPEDRERKRGRARRSPSPSRNNSGRGTPIAGGGTSGPMALADWEKQRWRCEWCKVSGTGTWAVREGPNGPKVNRLLSYANDETLCNACGVYWQEEGEMPEYRVNMHAHG